MIERAAGYPGHPIACAERGNQALYAQTCGTLPERVLNKGWRLGTRGPTVLGECSELVIAEAAVGDSEAVQRRAVILADLPLLDITPAGTELARRLAGSVPLPPRAAADAVHIAVAACHGIEFLLTWNATHIANAELRPLVERACRAAGYAPPVLCTPDELMGG